MDNSKVSEYFRILSKVDSIFLGFLPKQITPCPEWLKNETSNIQEVCSVSDCISKRSPNMYPADRPWNYNHAMLYYDTVSALKEIPLDEHRLYAMFAYKAYPFEIDKDGVREIDLLKLFPGGRPEMIPEPDLAAFTFVGYDLVQEINCLSFGCSPISCNRLADAFKVNSYCLIDDLQYAIATGMEMEIIGAEPPPYYIFEVYRQR